MYEYQSQDTTALAKALLAVQKQLLPALKDAANPFTKSSYATLNSVMGACREALHANHIWMTQLPMPTPAHMGDGHMGLMTKLTHTTSGQWQSSLMVVPLPKKDPQGMGSAMTYARRYALCAMLGIVTEDDDGQSATLGAKTAPHRASPPKQTENTPLANETPYDNLQLKNNQNTPSNQTIQHHDFSHLPRIDGVAYQQVTASDGRHCIVATGNTQAKKELLKGAGFQWNPQRKMWWRYADAA